MADSTVYRDPDPSPERVVTTLVHENLKAWEMGVYVQFRNLEGNGGHIKFLAPQCEPRVINPEVERLFWSIIGSQPQPIRQVAISFWNLVPLNLEPDLFGENRDLKRRDLHNALEQLEGRFGRRTVKTGTRLLMEQRAANLVGDKAKCPFVVQREMELKVGKIPVPMLDPTYDDEWQPMESEAPSEPPAVPRTWGPTCLADALPKRSCSTTSLPVRRTTSNK